MTPSVHFAPCGTPWFAWLVACGASALFHAAGLVALGLMWIVATSKSRVHEIVANVDDASQATTLDQLQLAPAEAPASGDHLPMARSMAFQTEALVEHLPLDLTDGAQTGSGGAFGVIDVSQTDLEVGERVALKALGKSASFYGIEANGSEFVFVVDMSGSMDGARFRRARNELRRSIESLEPYQSYFVIFFSDGAYPMPAAALLPRTDRNLRDTIRWLNQVKCQGPTNPLPALLQAIDMAPDAVFLLSDGRFEMEVALEVARYRTGDAIPIHTISFASREGEPMLKAIAKATGGTYRYVK